MMGLLLCALLLLAVPWQMYSQSASASPSPPASGTPEQWSYDEADTTIQNDLSDILSADPVLDGAEIHTTVNDRAITLSGTVLNEAQHQRALQLLQPYRQWRKVVDKITVK
ncbi:MAG TPA: BON domain-containing protein [Candidatus Angelobacter sp.]|jgi:osmotically-inducible protein OsmY